MPATVLVGTQWGDEGKGRFTDLFAKEMPRKSVHFAHVSAALVRFSVEVVCGQMVAARDENSVEVALFASHTMQRLERADDRDVIPHPELRTPDSFDHRVRGGGRVHPAAAT